MKHCLVFASLISPSKMILFEKKYQTFDTVFHHQMKHLEVRQKYSAARRIFNSLLGVSSGDETLHLMFDILLQTLYHSSYWEFRPCQKWEPAGGIGNFGNVLNSFAKSPRLIVLNIDSVQFVLKNCEILHLSEVGMINTAPGSTFSSQMWCIKGTKGWLAHPQICWHDFVK